MVHSDSPLLTLWMTTCGSSSFAGFFVALATCDALVVFATFVFLPCFAVGAGRAAAATSATSSAASGTSVAAATGPSLYWSAADFGRRRLELIVPLLVR